MEQADTNQPSNSQKVVKKPWAKPEIYLISAGYHVNGGPVNTLHEHNYTQSYFTLVTPGAGKALKGPGHFTIVPHTGNRYNYHS